jgi:hypothetical protein
MKTSHEEYVTHPAEELFDIEPGTTVIVKEENTSIAEIPDHTAYDAKDKEIEVHTQKVYDAAMTAYEEQQRNAALIEPKYASRAMEVAAQFLNTALAATKQRADVKTHKDKLSTTPAGKASTGGDINTQIIVSSFSDLLRQLPKTAQAPPIEGESTKQ